MQEGEKKRVHASRGIHMEMWRKKAEAKLREMCTETWRKCFYCFIQGKISRLNILNPLCVPYGKKKLLFFLCVKATTSRGIIKTSWCAYTAQTSCDLSNLSRCSIFIMHFWILFWRNEKILSHWTELKLCVWLDLFAFFKGIFSGV